jgi:hypothetical protein
MCGIILVLVPTIEYGGYFLLSIFAGNQKLNLTDFQKSMFRAGHVHAGMLVILSLSAQVLADYSGLGPAPGWLVRVGFPLAAILVSGGFFVSAIGKNILTPDSFVSILFVGVLLLAISSVILGIGLINSR